MRISVVTPSFNMAAYLEETIVSVTSNLVPGDEYFVIDGGSTDDSVEIIRKHKDKITAWVSEPDRGYADAIGKGFERASGDMLCWLNAGDLYLHGAFDAARNLIAGNDMIFGDDFHIDEESSVLSYSHGHVADLGSAMLFGGWTPLQDACFWQRGFYERIGGIDRALGYAADYDLFLRMALNGKCSYVPVAFSAFRRHAGQKSLAGAAAYRAEREAVRRRERSHRSATGFGKLAVRASWRARMSVRARLAGRRWPRLDLAGMPVSNLSTGRYWPVGSS